MCASYGLDPRFTDKEWRAVMDAAVIEALRVWAEEHRETIKPTGIRARNLNPLITAPDAWGPAWWGHLVDGRPARYPSINSRIERLQTWRRPLQTAIAPASYWREYQKPSKLLHHLDHGGQLLGLAAIAQPGVTEDGQEYTCYSLVMQPAAPQIEAVHDRMPLLIPAGFAEEWLTSTAPAGELLEAAQAASRPLSEQITAHPQHQSATLF